jgi:hypothetical protein
MASHVTDDLSAETIALSRDELRERMRSNLGRCGAHNGIAAAIAATVSWWATKFGFRLVRSSDDWQTGGVRPSREPVADVGRRSLPIQRKRARRLRWLLAIERGVPPMSP